MPVEETKNYITILAYKEVKQKTFEHALECYAMT